MFEISLKMLLDLVTFKWFMVFGESITNKKVYFLIGLGKPLFFETWKFKTFVLFCHDSQKGSLFHLDKLGWSMIRLFGVNGWWPTCSSKEQSSCQSPLKVFPNLRHRKKSCFQSSLPHLSQSGDILHFHCSCSCSSRDAEKSCYLLLEWKTLVW